jgi:glycolate oxidase FAD binding subunit
MSDPIVDRVTPIVGADAVRRGADGRLHLMPPTPEAVGGLLGLAHDIGWRVALEGGGTWASESPPADLVISLRALDDVAVRPGHPARLRAGAGTTLEAARREAMEHGLWFPLDAPGRPDRTLGSILATGTSGPLRHGVGPLRDLVTSLTVIRGDGHADVLHLAEHAEELRRQIGGFGGYGAIVACEWRLAPLPRADLTWVALADRDRLTATARVLANREMGAAAIELFSPALATEAEWLLAVRLVGTRETVTAQARQLVDAAPLAWHELPPERHVMLWNGTARAIPTVPVTIRLGVLPEGLDEAIDLVLARLGEGLLSAAPCHGGLRWSGEATAEQVRGLRGELAAREIPLTLERAPATLARAIGHFGSYREGGGGDLSRTRALHDPHGILAVPLTAEDLT